MGFAGIIELINGVLKFPGVILEFIKVLKKTPQENHDALLKRIAEESKQFDETGRPSW